MTQCQVYDLQGKLQRSASLTVATAGTGATIGRGEYAVTRQRNKGKNGTLG